MTLQNKLGITNPADLARDEERISRKKQPSCLIREFWKRSRSEPLKG